MNAVSFAANFNPRSPHGERPVRGCVVVRAGKFQPTLPARGATGQRELRNQARSISTHAPRTGSDRMDKSGCRCFCDFNPRSPHGERLQAFQKFQLINYFNPRSPHGERLLRHLGGNRGSKHFNPRSPHGERPCCLSAILLQHDFNPRSPHGERPMLIMAFGVADDFNPRSPHGERPSAAAVHASDGNFNPRSPHGERRVLRLFRLMQDKFQPTLPARGATNMPECCM